VTIEHETERSPEVAEQITAVHEAGHAMMAIDCGLRCREANVILDHDNQRDGVVIRDALDPKQYFMLNFLIIMAGPIAQKLFIGS